MNYYFLNEKKEDLITQQEKDIKLSRQEKESEFFGRWESLCTINCKSCSSVKKEATYRVKVSLVSAKHSTPKRGPKAPIFCEFDHHNTISLPLLLL